MNLIQFLSLCVCMIAIALSGCSKKESEEAFDLTELEEIEQYEDSLIKSGALDEMQKTDDHAKESGTRSVERAPASTSSPASNHDSHHWDYKGQRGPSSWGSIKPDYALCSHGKSQSPVDLKWKKPKMGREISFHYSSKSGKSVDNGHTIQFDVDPGSYVTIGKSRYDLIQFHFHSQSEHTLSGKHYPLELHLVHKDSKGKLAVVGILYKEGATENKSIAHLWKNIPDKSKEKSRSLGTFNVNDLLPSKLTYYNYKGSLTTPPCSEGVDWNVLNTPIEISKEQIATFQKYYTGNNRPLQALNGRSPINF